MNKPYSHKNLSNMTLQTCLRKVSLSTQDIVNLLPHLADELNLQYALLSIRCGEAWRTEVISFWTGKEYKPGFEYNLDGAPCEYIFQNEPRCFANDIQTRFPNDKDLAKLNLRSYAGARLIRNDKPAGHIAVMDQTPIKHCEKVLSLLVEISEKWDQK